MSRITRCRRSAPSSSAPLSPATMLKIVLAMGLVMAAGIVHVHLRVRLGELRREIVTLQSDQDRLLSEINEVRAANESLKTPRTLQAFARNELGMVPYNPNEREVVVIPQETRERYAMARAEAAGRMVAEAQRNQDARWIDTIGERIGLIGEATAAGPMQP